jgi:hypothetical protein
MNTRDLTGTLSTLLGELVDGPPGAAAYMLNRGDLGLLRSLDALTARDASSAVAGGASVAAHVDHLRYGLSLMNRWSASDNPFGGADWSASWQKTSVSDVEWQELRTALRAEAHRAPCVPSRRDSPDQPRSARARRDIAMHVAASLGRSVK